MTAPFNTGAVMVDGEIYAYTWARDADYRPAPSVTQVGSGVPEMATVPADVLDAICIDWAERDGAGDDTNSGN